ncbi:ftsJ-like methyltransferase domain-containing protein, putative [Eimeria necatrix]|uniref:Cap-specific mRNA (nucleoside-2'-O-)-methyltransferase 2 n=1 Tax=Eimeria necatrix TaxID=51315 RepID=U6MVF4_9EIME|nr:ftsJ-like methyltransferase domain-containing protein, putative [Eimeria necatrix]CDJ68202.1 ftsJ-like methyltransferase domain-containing protein, putative [Eimeria necatrix]
MDGSPWGAPPGAPDCVAEDIEIEKQYAFSTSLLSLQLEGPIIPGSDPPCAHCKSKRIKCICESVKLVGNTPGYGAPELEKVVQRLEERRNFLSFIPIDEWKRHTAKTDVLKKVIPAIKQKVRDREGHAPELLINSWTKFYEILAKTPIVKPRLQHLLQQQQQQQQQQQKQKQPRVFKSIHLCECPGGFVAATNHYVKTEARGVFFSWRAASLNPYFEGCSPLEVLDDDELYRHSERRWISSPDGSGNLCKKENIEFLWKQLTRQAHPSVPPFGLADLVTADGSFDVQHNPAKQEELVVPLVYAELVAILGLVQLHGSAVIKAYSLHSHHSVSLLAILSMCFERVAVVKPLMSRSGNSEVYLLGLGFRGIRSPLLRALSSAVDSFSLEKAIIPREWIPDAFLAECRKCAEFFTQLQAEHIELSIERYKSITSHELWQLSLQREQTAAEFIESNHIKPIRFEDRLVPDKDFVREWEANGYTNSTRKGSRERVQGVLADRIRFREVYMQLQQQREQKWQQHGGCSRALCLLTSQAGIDALLRCTYAPFEEAKTMSESGGDGELPGAIAISEFYSIDDEEDNQEAATQEVEATATWLCLYPEEPQQQQQQQQQQQSAPDVASFLTTFTARARQGWSEQQQQQQQQQQHRATWVPSAAAVAWRDEMLQGLQKGEYNARPSCWLYPLRPLVPYTVQISRFADDRLMTVVGQLRHLLPFLVPFSIADFLLLEGRPSALGEKLGGQELPPSSSIDLLFALKQLEATPVGPSVVFSPGSSRRGPPGPPEKDFPALWRKKYPVSVEISSWGAPLALPLQLMLRRHGCSCFVVLNLPLQQQEQQQQQQELRKQPVTREVLEAAIPKAGPLLGVQEIDVLSAFARGETADYIKRQVQEKVLSKLPGDGASLVSLDITGVQHWRREEAAQVEGEEEKNNFEKGEKKRRQRGLVVQVHEEIAQAEIEAGLLLLAQIFQGLLLLCPGGDLLLRIHSSYTRYTASLLLLLSLCFGSSCLYRPPSVACWSGEGFFLGRSKRKNETGFVLQLLGTAWGLLAAKHKAEKASPAHAEPHRLSGEPSSSSSSSSSSSNQFKFKVGADFVDWGGLTAHWALQQCIKAKLYTEQIANRRANPKLPL